MKDSQLTPQQIARSSLLSYIGLHYPKYVAEPMHKLIATALENVEAGKIKRLLIFAPPQHGKCTHEDTLITLGSGKRQKAKDIKVGAKLLGYKNRKLIRSELVAKEFTEKESIKLTTKTGREIIVSTDHRMLTYEGYKEAENITLDDFLLTIHREIEGHSEINEDELRFITYMIFEGMCETEITEGRNFSNIDPIVIKDFLRVCSNLKIHISKAAGENSRDFYVGVQSRDLLNKYKIRGHRCTNKRLPEEFFSMPLKQRWLFIDLMFQTDGYYALSAGQGGIALANKPLIEDIQTLLSTCGIASTKFYKPNDCSGAWVLTVGRSQLGKIYENCDLGTKRKFFAKILSKPGHSKITAFPNAIGKQLKRTRKNGFRCDNKKNITLERMQRMAKVYPKLEKYLNMDFIYDQVVKKEYVGIQNLVHLQTTNTHTYIANDLVSHNTMIASEFFPAWALGRNPDWKIIAATFNQTKANEVGGVVREQFRGNIYKTVFPNCVVAPDIQSSQHIATMSRGHYYSIGLSGTGTGRGADCLTGETQITISLNNKIETISMESLYSLRHNNRIKVLSFDHIHNKMVFKPLTTQRKIYANKIYTITTNSGIELSGTNDHKLFLPREGFYAKFSDVNSSIFILKNDGLANMLEEEITEVKHNTYNNIPVYDIQVEGTNNFFANEILVHNCILIDDPFKGREDSESKLARKKVEEFYTAVAYSRLRPGGRIVIINTRWHCNDLSGYVLENFPFENWKIIDLKAIAEENDILKRNPGEALCPNMYPVEELLKMKRVQGTYNWESLYQQRPIPREGGMIKYEWIEDNAYTKIPANEEITKTVISWDTAYRANELNDPTAASVWQITKNGYYLIDVLNKKLEFYQLVQAAKMLHDKYHPSAHLVEGRASGQTFIDELRRTTTLPIIEISTKNLDKHIRLDAVSGIFESGKVHFPEKALWLIEAKDQLCLFPSHKHDDITDSVSQFLNWVNKPRYIKRSTNNLYWK